MKKEVEKKLGAPRKLGDKKKPVRIWRKQKEIDLLTEERILEICHFAIDYELQKIVNDSRA
jgi:hypothetical protein